MGINSALNAAVSGLQAQGAAIAAVSENIANADTTAFKIREISFESLVSSGGVGGGTSSVGGGVLFDTRQALETQGLVEFTGVSTNIAINGGGFFVVTDDPQNQPAAFQYTRNGDFRTNEDGLVINNEGSILLGQPTDENGVVTTPSTTDLNSLQPVDLNAISGTASSTTEVEVDLNVPADAAIGSTFSTAIEVFDQLGVSHTIIQNYERTASNEYTITFDDPFQTSLGPGTTPTSAIDVDGAGGNVLTLQFNGDGSINTINGNPAALQPISLLGLGATTGANDLLFNLDIGSQGGFDGITQFASNTATPDIEIAGIEQDGVRFGGLSGVEVNDEGLVIASFDNGINRPIFQIPIATFPNPAGLTNVSGTIYDENEEAGNFILQNPGEGNAGTIEPNALEGSATDISTEFNKLIVAQQAFSSAAQVVSTADELFTTLIQAVA